MPGAPQSPPPTDRTVAVVVDYNAGPVMAGCVRSLRDHGVDRIVVVENGSAGGARAVLAADGLEAAVVAPGRNLGYGAGANRGMAAAPGAEFVLVCNPDLAVHPGAVAALEAALDAEPSWALVGPRVVTPSGETYPSVRAFPSMGDAAGHALLALFKPDNRFSRRYRRDGAAPTGREGADWVSGACFLARRRALEELGGFDESYFMFAEDMDLCWRAHRAGWGIGVEPRAVVTHDGGVTRRTRPYRMLVAHHRSAWRFAVHTTEGWRRLALPLAAVVLALRLGLACADQALRH